MVVDERKGVVTCIPPPWAGLLNVSASPESFLQCLLLVEFARVARGSVRVRVRVRVCKLRRW